MELEQLKARAYDLIVQIERMNLELRQISQKILELSQKVEKEKVEKNSIKH